MGNRRCKKTYNPCDECRYGYSKQNQESYTCKICEFKKYIDEEQQGMLLRLPCKVGVTVYVVGSKCLANVVQDEECNSIDCDKCNYLHENIVFERKVDRHYLSLIVFGHNENFIFGKTVFLTKEEADAALERLESAKAAKEKPTKSAEEHFRRKPYQKKGEKNV